MSAEPSLTELTDDQLPAVVRLCRSALDLPDDSAEAAQIVARLRDDSPLPGAAGPRRTVGVAAWRDGALAGVALGSMADRGGDRAVGHLDLVAVHPELRRRGIGRALLSRVEQALAGLGATQVRVAGNPPHYVWPGIDVRYTPAICTVLALGYTSEETAWNMTADLSTESSPALRPTGAAERRLAERGVTVRRAEPADLPMLTDFARSTFGGTWDLELLHSVGRPDAGCHLAVRTPTDGGTPEVLGFAAYGSSRPSWFGPMGTAPGAQGLGIGGVLLRRCLRDQRAAGRPRAEIGWVGPVPFYANNAGARIERVFFLYRKQLR
ncbi:GNAT family N-acetyltransferase [Micromonospora sp. WMMD1102]|uniref:GNAT family N-acetyltransferase n=1 Tax=Micromonospora sp. WMMD1102 TaxID=3016105 RepID=UPI002414D602|nr:GNAT family N-acetyltransferase [Micromonospora sp. WMMD1102]MDG4791493.1 GNAT family N-acetyltransferase [Micromonospora sp. WMMD1102]